MSTFDLPIDHIFFFFAVSFLATIFVSPFFIVLLRSLGIVRKGERDLSTLIGDRKDKVGTPLMGGLIIVLIVALMAILFNWDRATTYVPIGVFLLSAVLGGTDDLLNIFFKKTRPVRTLGRIMRLIKTHQNPLKRIEYALMLPWHAYKRFFYLLGSHPGHG